MPHLPQTSIGPSLQGTVCTVSQRGWWRPAITGGWKTQFESNTEPRVGCLPLKNQDSRGSIRWKERRFIRRSSACEDGDSRHRDHLNISAAGGGFSEQGRGGQDEGSWTGSQALAERAALWEQARSAPMTISEPVKQASGFPWWSGFPGRWANLLELKRLKTTVGFLWVSSENPLRYRLLISDYVWVYKSSSTETMLKE